MPPFFWDAGNIQHIAAHGIDPAEVEQVVANEPFDVAMYLRNGEERLNQVGETDAGRVLVVVTTERSGMVRVVTAHPADRSMRKLYQELKEERNGETCEGSGLQE